MRDRPTAIEMITMGRTEGFSYHQKNNTLSLFISLKSFDYVTTYGNISSKKITELIL